MQLSRCSCQTLLNEAQLAILDIAGDTPRAIVDGSAGTGKTILARELYTAAKAQSKGFIDAPVSGGQAGAENGKLGIMCGGDLATFDRVKDVLAVYAKACVRIGDAGGRRP